MSQRLRRLVLILLVGDAPFGHAARIGSTLKGFGVQTRC
jgi:hypothetical protein